MNAQVALHVFIRLLPSIILFLTGYLCYKDERMRSRWADLLFKAGSIRSAQKEDQAIRDKVRLPFFIIGGLFLIWPVYYLWHDSYAQRPVETIALPTTNPVALPTPKGAPAGTAMPGTTPVPGTVVPGAAPAPGAPAPVAPPPAVPPPAAAPSHSNGAVPLPPRP